MRAGRAIDDVALLGAGVVAVEHLVRLNVPYKVQRAASRCHKWQPVLLLVWRRILALLQRRRHEPHMLMRMNPRGIAFAAIVHRDKDALVRLIKA